LTQIPAIPPSIELMNMTKRRMVLEAVGKISDAMRLAEEDAGEANTKANTTTVSRQKNELS
jgi:hypothetical protein